MIVCAGKSEQFEFAQPIGIGMVEAAVNLARICEKKKPDHIVFVGTAGSYGEKEIFEIIESRTAANVEQSFFSGDSYTPIDNVISAVAYGGAEGTTPSVPNLQTISSYRLLDGSHVSRETREAESNSLDSVGLKPERWSKATRAGGETIVNSSNYITINKDVWQHYRAQNIHIENMEFFAVMKVAQMYGIPAAGILIVTNYCDENAHEDFKKNHEEAMHRLTSYVKARAEEQK